MTTKGNPVKRVPTGVVTTGFDAGWSSLVARRAHNPKVVGSNPAPATKSMAAIAQAAITFKPLFGAFLYPLLTHLRRDVYGWKGIAIVGVVDAHGGIFRVRTVGSGAFIA